MKNLLFCILCGLFLAACATKQAPVVVAPSVESGPKRDYSKIALIIPQKVIKGYSNVIINATLAYLIRQDSKISTQVFLTNDESDASLGRALKEIEAQNFGFVIAATTLKGANFIAQAMPSDIIVYLPTLHKNDTQISAQNIFFGRIDYDAQIAKLLEKGNSNLAIFSDNSALSNNLQDKVRSIAKGASTRIYNTSGEKINYARLTRSQGPLSGSSVFLNVPIVTGAIIISQLHVANQRPQAILYTQIGYNPILLKLAQPESRYRLSIANSIDNEDRNLAYINEMFFQSIDYNWMAYVTSVGLDYFYANLLNKEAKRLFKEQIKDRQLIYEVKLMKTLEFSFSEDK